MKIKKKSRVSDVLAHKNIHGISSVPPFFSVYDCVRKMYDENIGVALVMKGGHISGIISERDITRRVILDKWNPETTTVDSVMTTFLESIAEDASLYECASVMRRGHCRHLVVKNKQGDFFDIISERDILHYLMDIEY